MLRRLAERRGELRSDFHVRALFVVGSVARDEAGAASDVDLLVDFSRPVGLFHFIRLRNRLQEILGSPVDLTTEDALAASVRESLLEDAVRAA